MKLGRRRRRKSQRGRAALIHYANQPLVSSRRFQPGEGPSRGLLCDCKTSRNLREPLFEALVSMLWLALSIILY